MTQDITLLLFAVAIIILIGANIWQYRYNGELLTKLNKANKKVEEANKKVEDKEKEKEAIFDIDPGDKCIIQNYSLTWTETDNDGKKTKTSFEVTYEVEIVEVSSKNLKVRATNAIPHNSFSQTLLSDPANKADVVGFMKDKWIERNRVELVVDDAKRRADKINQILSEK